MNDKKRFPRIFLAGVLAVGVAGGVGAAWAGLNTLGEGRGIAPLLDDEAVAELHLNPVQMALMRQARAQSGLVADTVQAEMRMLRQRLDNALASDEPDLRTVFEKGMDTRRQTVLAAIDQTRELRLALYDSLSAEQKRLVAGHIEKRLSRFDRMRSLIGRLLLNQATL